MASCRNSYIVSTVGAGKLATVVFGAIVVIIGLRSHFESAWVKYDYHQICQLDHKPFEGPCPDIAMERFYVAIVIICFILSVIGLILSTFVLNPYRLLFWIFDVGFHSIASLLLFIAAILHIVSAIKISNHPVFIDDNHEFLPPYITKINDTEVFLGTQKIIAGVITILESFVYIVNVSLIKRARARLNQESTALIDEQGCHSDRY